jgi:cobalt-zinc-cadmium efflux system membrane fusion protein
MLAIGFLALAACSGGGEEVATPAEDREAASVAPAIETAEAQVANAVPLGNVPGRVTLPPDARVAVTPPFPGAAMRVYVIEGQAVRRGDPLALVRAAEPVSISADLARARSELNLVQARAERMRQLGSEGIIAQARVDEAEASLIQARASLSEAQRLASMSGTGPDGTMTLRSPIAGRVAHVGVETGGPMDGMEAPFVIEAASAFRIEMQLPERLAHEVRPGMAVEIQLPTARIGDAIPIGGEILSVAPSIDPVTRSVMATANIGQAPGLVAGQNVMVVVSGASGGSGVSVPANAVTRIGGEDHVFVHGDGGFTLRPVTVVANAGGLAVISSGLSAGETVATSGMTELKAASAE